MHEISRKSDEQVRHINLTPATSNMLKVTVNILHIDGNICQNDAETDQPTNVAGDLRKVYMYLF